MSGLARLGTRLLTRGRTVQPLSLTAEKRAGILPVSPTVPPILPFGSLRVVITFFFVNVIVMTVPGVPATMACILIPAYVGLTNIMACAVFRGMALGVYEDIPGTERIAFELGGWDEGVEARPGEFGLHDINLTDSACAIAQGGGC
ncbi:hypothetical protein HWV62_22752 [Athelia sp. TMB]|nr:hypothetical protein HWV62_22752 [Athelia sp. TMB]